MSLFLGNIHYWLYNKIMVQNALTNELIEKLDYEYLKEELDEKYGQVPKGELEDIIDTSNIHGSLQSFIIIVENRLARVLREVIEKKDIDRARSIAFDFGKRLQKDVEENREMKYYYEILNNIFVNGMPCDGANEIISEEEEKFLYRTRRDIFVEYYDTEELEMLHKDIKSKLANGIFDGRNIIVNSLEEDYFLIRRA